MEAYTPLISIMLKSSLASNYAEMLISNRLDYVVSDTVCHTVIYKYRLSYSFKMAVTTVFGYANVLLFRNFGCAFGIKGKNCVDDFLPSYSFNTPIWGICINLLLKATGATTVSDRALCVESAPLQVHFKHTFNVGVTWNNCLRMLDEVCCLYRR